eukprot:INCI16293.3.p1 GENE.INCI16293.3~~INCI16293.3.p1  ORF type:complete len:133 (+),score=11.30 INCI16293.3:824-1222(+)
MIPMSYVRRMKPEEVADIIGVGRGSAPAPAPAPAPAAAPAPAPAPKPKAPPAPKPPVPKLPGARGRPDTVPAEANVVTALYDLEATDVVLGFSAGDKLWVHDHADAATNADWYKGYTHSGAREGLVPRNYVE